MSYGVAGLGVAGGYGLNGNLPDTIAGWLNLESLDDDEMLYKALSGKLPERGFAEVRRFVDVNMGIARTYGIQDPQVFLDSIYAAFDAKYPIKNFRVIYTRYDGTEVPQAIETPPTNQEDQPHTDKCCIIQ